MTFAVVHSNKPTALVLNAEGSDTFQMFTDLESPSLAIVQAQTTTCLYEYSRNETCKLSAIVIDAAIGWEAIEAAVEQVHSNFKKDEGPILVVMDGEQEADDPLNKIKHIKTIDRHLGARALRRFLAEEIERYSIVCALRREMDKRTSAIGQIVQGIFQFKTRREAQNLATMLSLTCKEPMPVALGLTELFVNAIEHGCLEIGHDEKGQLLETGQLADEIKRRQQVPAYRDRVATVDFRREGDALFFTVKDPGPGFNYETYMVSQDSHAKKHGRGIMMAKGCFSSLSYHGCGNEVHAVYSFSMT